MPKIINREAIERLKRENIDLVDVQKGINEMLRGMPAGIYYFVVSPIENFFVLAYVGQKPPIPLFGDEILLKVRKYR